MLAVMGTLHWGKLRVTESVHHDSNAGVTISEEHSPKPVPSPRSEENIVDYNQYIVELHLQRQNMDSLHQKVPCPMVVCTNLCCDFT